MNLKIVKFLVISALLCSAIFAVTGISINLYTFHKMTGNRTSCIYYENIGQYTPCGGDPVPGGGFPEQN